MSIYKAVQKTITLDGAGAGVADFPLTSYGGAARLISAFFKYTATGAGTSIALTDSLSGKSAGAATVGNTNIEVQYTNMVMGGQIHVVMSAGTAAGQVQITLYIDAV